LFSDACKLIPFTEFTFEKHVKELVVQLVYDFWSCILETRRERNTLPIPFEVILFLICLLFNKVVPTDVINAK